VYNFTVLLERGSWYSLTTLPDGAVAKGEHAHSELPALFPLPHADAFDEAGNYTAGRSPKFFTDWDGSFSLEADPHGGGAAGGGIGGGLVLRQLVPARPLHWHCTDVDPITLVSSGHANYAVGVRARIDSSTTESYSSTHVAVWARVLRPYSGWCPALSGYRLRLTPSGEWFLEAAPPASGKAMAVLAKGVLPSGFDGRAWHELLLTADGSKLTASVDGALLATVQDTSFDSGSAALGSGFHLAAFRAFNLTALRPPAPAAVAATSPTGGGTHGGLQVRECNAHARAGGVLHLHQRRPADQRERLVRFRLHPAASHHCDPRRALRRARQLTAARHADRRRGQR
jgi:galactosylceramidase